MLPANDKRPAKTKAVKPFKSTQLLFSVLLGLAATVWLFPEGFDLSVFAGFRFTFGGIAFIVPAFLLIFLRDFAQMGRLRLLAGGQLSWCQSFVMNVLCVYFRYIP